MRRDGVVAGTDCVVAEISRAELHDQVGAAVGIGPFGAIRGGVLRMPRREAAERGNAVATTACDRNTEQLNACIAQYNKVMEAVNGQR